MGLFMRHKKTGPVALPSETQPQLQAQLQPHSQPRLQLQSQPQPQPCSHARLQPQSQSQSRYSGMYASRIDSRLFFFGKRAPSVKVAAFFLACLLGLAPMPFRSVSVASAAASANEMSAEDKAAIDRARQQMEDVANKVAELAKEQDRLSAQQQTVLGEMKRLSGQIAGLEKEIAALDARIVEKEAEITDKEEQVAILIGDIEVKTMEVDEREDYLDQRLNQIYRDGDLSMFDVLFASTSLTDFLTRYDLMERVASHDVSLLTELRQARVELEMQKAELETQKTELEAIKATLEEEKAVVLGKKGELGQQWGAQNRMSSALSADLALAEEAEDELAVLTKQLEKFVADVQAKYKEAYMGSGTMGWPVPGWSNISSPYGMRVHPIYGTPRFHTGIDIPAYSGTRVNAVEKGKVIMASMYGGFGNTVILDHGGGVASQYSHLVSINVVMGQEVDKGEKVGGVGTTGLSTGNHLHFQIMIDGATVDPLSGKYYVSPN